MNAIILAAGLGTRLRPITDNIPKALIEVEGEPMLSRIIRNLENCGCNKICINVHHLGEKIIDFIRVNNFTAQICISDEREFLLDTGGGVIQAYKVLNSNSPALVHNVDIITNCDLRRLYERHVVGKSGATLLVSDRESTRHLVFDDCLNLKGWHDVAKNKWRPQDFCHKNDDKEFAFSGIYVIDKTGIKEMEDIMNIKNFPIMDYFLSPERKNKIRGIVEDDIEILDIGKPASLLQAPDILYKIGLNNQ